MFVSDTFGLNAEQQGLLTTTAVLGQMVGALGAGVLADRIGRQRCMVLITAGYAVFALAGAASPSMPMLVCARLLIGLTVGVSVVVIPVYVAESAPAKVRGSLLAAYQLTTVSGVVLGYLVGYLMADAHNWRAILGLASVPAAVLLVLVLRLPDSPRWYLLNNRVDDARRALRGIYPSASTADIDAEVAAIQQAVGEETSGGAGRIWEMVRPPYRRATLFVVALGFLIQITGINAIVYYSPRLFGAMGFTGYVALLGLPALVQVIGLAAVIAAMVLVDKVGRKPILLSGITMMIVADLILVGVFGSGGLGGASLVFGFTAIVLFIVGFDFGFGTMAWVFAGESFPSRLRSLGSSAMLTSSLAANAVIAAGFLTMLNDLGGAGTFAVFALLAAVSFAMIYRFAPETKGRQLEEIAHFWENGGRW